LHIKTNRAFAHYTVCCYGSNIIINNSEYRVQLSNEIISCSLCTRCSKTVWFGDIWLQSITYYRDCRATKKYYYISI